eukprot:8546597-Pyramimonas_sp.AAC.1
MAPSGQIGSAKWLLLSTMENHWVYAILKSLKVRAELEAEVVPCWPQHGPGWPQDYPLWPNMAQGDHQLGNP